MPAIIRRDRPEEALFCAAAARIANRSRRFIRENAVRRGEMLGHVIGDRLGDESRRAPPPNRASRDQENRRPAQRA